MEILNLTTTTVVSTTTAITIPTRNISIFAHTMAFNTMYASCKDPSSSTTTFSLPTSSETLLPSILLPPPNGAPVSDGILSQYQALCDLTNYATWSLDIVVNLIKEMYLYLYTRVPTTNTGSDDEGKLELLWKMDRILLPPTNNSNNNNNESKGSDADEYQVMMMGSTKWYRTISSDPTKPSTTTDDDLKLGGIPTPVALLFYLPFLKSLHMQITIISLLHQYLGTQISPLAQNPTTLDPRLRAMGSKLFSSFRLIVNAISRLPVSLSAIKSFISSLDQIVSNAQYCEEDQFGILITASLPPPVDKDNNNDLLPKILHSFNKFILCPQFMASLQNNDDGGGEKEKDDSDDNDC